MGGDFQLLRWQLLDATFQLSDHGGGQGIQGVDGQTDRTDRKNNFQNRGIGDLCDVPIFALDIIKTEALLNR